MFKDHKLYKFYETWIDLKSVSQSHKRLLKMSESSFIQFAERYANSLEFKERIDDLMVKEIRDEKLGGILEDDDFFGTI